jgi:nucleotidyltransferase/DNA polymerase involved in DNA repair
MVEKRPLPRRILHVDMDAFFAAIELLRHPELEGKPLVVGGGGDPFKRGVVSTASYEARKFGIHSAMPLRTAYQLCHECVFLPVDYQEYVRVSRKIKHILATFSTVIEDVGIDEAFLDISEIDKTAEQVGQEIKLIGRFGESYGNYLYRASRGRDENPLVTKWEPKSMSRETTFDEDAQEWQVIAHTLAEMAKLVTQDIQKGGYKARTVAIKIRFSDFKTYTRAKTLERATDNLETIRRTAFECLSRIELKQRVRLIGVRATGLENINQLDNGQPSL